MKRALIVGCSHGHLIDKKARDAVLKFKDEYKPDFVAHLGDAFDTTALRSGAPGTKDEAEPIAPDISSGLEFLSALQPHVYLLGNHEARLWRLAEHYNAVVAELSQRIIDDIESRCAKLGIKMVPYNIKQAYPLADYVLMHGVNYSQNATYWHCLHYGNVVHAHTHRPAYECADRIDSAKGFCVGTLMNIAKAEYAQQRPSTLRWGHALVFGEYDNKHAHLGLKLL